MYSGYSGHVYSGHSDIVATFPGTKYIYFRVKNVLPPLAIALSVVSMELWSAQKMAEIRPRHSNEGSRIGECTHPLALVGRGDDSFPEEHAIILVEFQVSLVILLGAFNEEL